MSSKMMISIGIKGRIFGAAQKDEMTAMLASSLRILSTVQLTRFAVNDIVQLMSGKGGLGDVLSLLINAVLLTYRYNQLLDLSIVKQTALNVTRAFGAFASGNLVGAALLLGGTAVAGMLIPAAGYSLNLNTNREATYQELAWRAMSG